MQPYKYPDSEHTRRHGPHGYTDYERGLGTSFFFAASTAFIEKSGHGHADLAGLTAEQSTKIVGLLMAWIVGDSLNKTV